MVQKEIFFNLPQIESEQLAKIAVGLIPETWGGKVKIFGDLVGVEKDGIFYTATIDGVGTKLEIAQKLNSFYELGIDVVNSQTNDLARFGIEPQFFLSLVSAAGKSEEGMRELVLGEVFAAKNVGVPIIGGETEVLQGVFRNDETINVAVAAFGWCEVSKLITRQNILPDDGIFGLASTGIHTNGFSEIVARFEEIDLEETLFDLSCEDDLTVADWLRQPTANYLPDFRLLREAGIEIKGAENVTGGGFTGRLLKFLEGTQLKAVVDLDSWTIPPIFEYLQQKFGWLDEQMKTTYNMGIGMFLVIAKEDCQKAVEIMRQNNRKIYQIGELQ